MKVLKFGAIWCSACLIMKPRFEEIEKENPWLKNEYYDFDEDKEAVEKYNINDALPIFIFLDKNDKEILRLEGEHSKKVLENLISEHRDK